MPETLLLLDPAQVAADLVADRSLPAAETIPASPSSEMDAGGFLFKPGRHKIRPDGTPFKNKFGRFMPIGGQKARPVGTPAPAPSQENPAPAHDSTPGPAIVPPAPEKSAWGAAEQATANGTPLPEPPPAAAPNGGPAPTVPTGPDLSEDAAEVGARLLYFVTGLLFGSIEEATPDRAEHDNLRQAGAAYVRTTGWKGSARVCMILRALAYLLRVATKPAGAATCKKWWSGFTSSMKAKPEPMRVNPTTPAPGQRAQDAPVSVMPRWTERGAGVSH